MINNTNSSIAVVIKSDPQLNIIWTKEYNINSHDIFYSITPTSDGDFLIGGAISHDIFDPPKGSSLIKIDASGNVLWNKLYEDLPDDKVIGISELEDGSLMLFISGDSSNESSKVIHTDASGSIISQQKIVTNSSGLSIRDVCEDTNENFLFLWINVFN